MKQTRKILQEILINSLRTEQMNHLARDLNPDFDMDEVSGYGEKIVVPKQVAADCILRYFSTDDKILEFIAYMMSRRGMGASGGVIQLKGIERLIDSLRKKGWLYDEKQHRFQKDQSQHRTSDWGFMREGQEYQTCLTSIDVVGSSELIRTNVKEDVEITMSRLRSYIYAKVEEMEGRIWAWYGDGGMAVFHGDESVNHCFLSMIQILSYLPIFNIAQSELRAETDIKLRVGMHYGKAAYHQDISKVMSPDWTLTMEVEKHCSSPNSIALTGSVFQSLRPEIRAVLTDPLDFKQTQIYSYILP